MRTLCNKVLAAGDYREVDAEVDCQLCRKRQDDPALVSSAFFEGDVGSQLLEMSLEKARAGRNARQAAASQSSSRHAPGRSGPAIKKRGPAPSAGSPPKTQPERDATTEKPSRIGDLELANLTQVSENVYRSPAGAVIRTRRRGADWEVAEVVFDGDVQVKRDAGGLRLKVGDVVLEYGPDGRLRARYRSG